MFNIGTKSPDHKDAHYRSLTKAVTWRLTGSFDTLVLSFLITGNIKIAGTISAVEIVTKILLFYFHERIWALEVACGRRPTMPMSVGRRSAVKRWVREIRLQPRSD